MTAPATPRRSGVVLLAATAAAAFWAGWGLGALPHSLLISLLGAGLVAAAVLVALGAAALGLAGTLLGLCTTATLLVVLSAAEDASQVAGNLALWPLVLSLFAALMALSLMPGMATRAAIARGAFLFALGLTLALPLGGAGFVDRWILASPVHLLIAFAACLVFAAQAMVALAGRPDPDEARFTQGMAQLLPLLGFAGTVWGIMIALGSLPAIFADAQPSPQALQSLLGGLGTAFETTLVGLAATVVASVVDLLLPQDSSA